MSRMWHTGSGRREPKPWGSGRRPEQEPMQWRGQDCVMLASEMNRVAEELGGGTMVAMLMLGELERSEEQAIAELALERMGGDA